MVTPLNSNSSNHAETSPITYRGQRKEFGLRFGCGIPDSFTYKLAIPWHAAYVVQALISYDVKMGSYYLAPTSQHFENCKR